MKFKLIVIVAIMVIASDAFAQSRRFDNLLDLRVNNAGVIQNAGEVSGYYFFYSLGSAKKGMKQYVLQILDENLQDVNTTTLEESKRTMLVEAQYNGKNILMKMWDMKFKKMSYLSFNTRGELVNRQEVDAPLGSGNMYGVNDDGFVDYFKEYKSKAYATRFIPNYGEGEKPTGWRIGSPEIKKNTAYGNLLCVSDDMILTLVSNKRSATSARIEFEIQAIDIQTGKEVFRTPLKENYNSQPFLGFYDEQKGQFNIMGLYYDPETKALKDNGIGMFNYTMTKSGEIIDRKHLAWTNEFREWVKIDNDGKLMSEDQKGFMYFHNIVRHEDGSIVAVAEQYQKVADAAGIALNVLSAALTGNTAASNTKIQVYDMVLFHFNPDFSIKGVQFIPKTKSNITIPEGYDFVNVHLLTEYVKSIGGFDYLFTTQNKQEGTTTVAYLDYIKREDGNPRQWVFNATTLYDDTFTADKLNIGRPSDAKNMLILPAKPGHILVIEVVKEDESVEMYLEKINY